MNYSQKSELIKKDEEMPVLNFAGDPGFPFLNFEMDPEALIYLFIYLYVCLFVCLFIYLFIYSFIYLFLIVLESFIYYCLWNFNFRDFRRPFFGIYIDVTFSQITFHI